MCSDKGVKGVTANGLYRSVGGGYSVYGGGGGGGGAIATKKLKNCEVLPKYAPPPEAKIWVSHVERQRHTIP